ncbi:MerR family transcriptional regulator [Hoyosella sp. YIM 151337]|uniref:HEAT repeat domain-containing protein n=1 Tax=Hoyosella sp. YIM 151337 TaxID=2992742 RepID=UPI0022362239|nr:HEAT repeat domain-containing protein [Hoyosella sp. YIM 151337]MCW4354042.1 MerR family transcriptional regulator [Hoyosella sp. YIM 151337]
MLIGEVSRRSGVSARMLRHYDKLGLVQPTGRTSGGYREYSPDDIQRIFHVESLRSLGLSLPQIRRALDDPDFTPAALVGTLIHQTQERIERDNELLVQLQRVNSSAPTDWRDVLRIVRMLHALDSEHAALRLRAALSDDATLPADVLADAMLAENDPNVASALQWALARAGSDTVAFVARGLAAPDAEVRLRAIASIAAVDGPETTALLTGALKDPDTSVRGRAALALAARGERAAASTLIDMVADGVRDVEAAEALGRLAHIPETSARVVAELVERLGSDSDPRIRLRLAQALAEIPGVAAVQALSVLTHDADPPVARTAQAILRNLG